MRVLATGGAGYIGSVVVRQLAAAGHDVTVLDTLELGRRDRVAGVPLVVGDVADQPLVRDVLRTGRIEAVLHFAAYRSVEASLEDPARCYANNVGGSVRLLRAMVDCGVRQLVFSSTCAVYGSPDVLPVTEATPLQPMSPYARSKRMVEDVIADLASRGRLQPAVLRYFNAAGAVPEAGLGDDDGTSLFSRVVDAARDQRPLQVFGTDYATRDGTCVRDFVHVEDLARAHLLALDHVAAGGALTANLGTGTGTTVLDVINAVERASGRLVPWEPAPRRDGDPVESWADIGHATRTLGWTPRLSVDDVAASAWAFSGVRG